LHFVLQLCVKCFAMSSTYDTTAGESYGRPPRDRLGARPHLFVAFECERPLWPTVRHRLDVDAIEAIECLVPPTGMPIVAEPREAKLRPRTPYDAQFSLPYSVAAAFVDGRVDLDTYAAERLGEGSVLALADRVTCRPDPDTTFPNGFPGWVRVRLAGGRVVEAREPDGRGGPARLLPPGAIVEKFRANAGRVLPATRVAELERATLSLDTLADVRSLMPLCRG